MGPTLRAKGSPLHLVAWVRAWCVCSPGPSLASSSVWGSILAWHKEEEPFSLCRLEPLGLQSPFPGLPKKRNGL